MNDPDQKKKSAPKSLDHQDQKSALSPKDQGENVAPKPASAKEDTLCVGKIAGAHGLKGFLKILSFTQDPLALFNYADVMAQEENQPLTFLGSPTLQGSYRGAPLYLVRTKQITHRSAAEALRGCFLHVRRANLPAMTEDEFYHADLVGLSVVSPAKTVLGKVKSVANFGGGTLLEIYMKDVPPVQGLESLKTPESQKDTILKSPHPNKAQQRGSVKQKRLQKKTVQRTEFIRLHPDHAAIVPSESGEAVVIVTDQALNFLGVALSGQDNPS